MQTAVLTYYLNLECTAKESYRNFLFLGMKMLSYLVKNKLLVCAVFSRWVDTI